MGLRSRLDRRARPGFRGFPGGKDAGGHSFTETTRQTWFSRIGGALTGILAGFVLLPVAGFLLFRNESRAVQTARSLAEGAGLVLSITAERPDPASSAGCSS